jgi:hypothetical protein
MEMRNISVAAITLIAVSGCMNLATKPSEITGSYTSDLRYQNYNCEQLGHEVNSLARRENQLATAQEQRRKSGKVQAFWLGYGTGDGIEAAELANVRGEKEAVRRAMDLKGCGAPTTPSTTQLPASGAQSSPADAVQKQQASGNNWRGWGQATQPSSQSKVLYRCPNSNGAAGCTVISP